MNSNSVEKIRTLLWGAVPLCDLVVASAYSALEFAESLRIALKLFPDSLPLRQMAEEELETTNLRFGNYNERGDHAAFLWFYIDKFNLLAHTAPHVVKACEDYIQKIRTLPEEVRVMSIVSREVELPGIFQEIRQVLENKTLFSSTPMPEWAWAYRYFVEEHIRLDAQPGGHAEQVADLLPLDDDRVEEFWELRLELYQSLFD